MFAWFRQTLRRATLPLLGVTLAIAMAMALRSLLADRMAVAAREAGDQAYDLLAPMDGPGLSRTLDNAVDPDPGVARPARDAVVRSLDAARAVSQTRGDGVEAERAIHVCLELVERSDRMTRSGVAWGERVAETLLRRAPTMRQRDRLAVMRAASDLLSRLGATPPQADLPTAPSGGPADRPAVVAETREKPSTSQAAPAVETAPTAPPAPAVVAEAPAAPPTIAPSPEPAPWRPDWRDTGPTARIEPAPASLPSAPETAPELGVAAMSDRALIAELLRRSPITMAPKEPTATGPAESPTAVVDPRRNDVAAELSRRGYVALRREHAERLLSDDPAVRATVVRELLTDGGHAAAKLLLLLAADEEPRVRAAAVAALGVSPHRQLVQQALAIALRDADARVAAMATELRDRLR